MILLEGLVLAAIGCFAGLLLSHVGMSLLAGKLKEAYQYHFEPWMFLREEGYLILVGLFIGLFAALIPAIQASRTDISKTLSEG